ncbi:MAG: HD domain-containing phosphohydrolase [Candidatus Gastranaerophilaceae bacterium]
MDLIDEQKNNSVEYACNLINTAIKEFIKNNYSMSENLLKEALPTLKDNRDSANFALCLALQGVLLYIKDKSNYQEALSVISDAKYLATYLDDKTVRIFVEFVLGFIYKSDKNYELAKLSFDCAKNLAFKNDELNLLNVINENLTELQSISNGLLANRADPLVALVKISQSISAETNIDQLIKTIVEETKEAIQADRCTVFLYDEEKNEIWSKVALGLENSEIRFPADKGLAGHCVKTGETINIKDAYNDPRFNPEIDLKTGYKTKTILCMPIKNLQQKIIGAFQVLNKLEGCFSDLDEDLMVAIGSSAGIALENAQLFKTQQKMLEEQKIVFESFIETLAASIDARDKITAGHSTRVKMYSSLIAKAMNLNEREVNIIEKAAILHDIGKIGIRDSVLQKEGRLTPEEYEHIQSHVEITHDILQKIHMSDDFKKVTEIACSHHEKLDGSGYYRFLNHDEIPLGGRILAVADVFDAITSKRHYRDKMPIKKVMDILLNDSGTHFDGAVVDVFMNLRCNDIIEVFLTENHLNINDADSKFLSLYTMKNLYDILNLDPDTLDNTQQNFVSMFNRYYYGYETMRDMNND